MNLIYEYLDDNNEKCNPLDACYRKLKADIKPIEKNSTTFSQICNVIKNTHGATHHWYTMDVLDVFEIQREGEVQRFEKHKNLSNHQLLWHGSRLMNFVSILSKGLKIAPPEAPGGKNIPSVDDIEI